MAEYINRKEALDTLMFAFCGSGYQALAMREIKTIPAADVAAVVHGRWKRNHQCQLYCSRCLEYQDPAIEKPYCSNCGARMDEEDADGE